MHNERKVLNEAPCNYPRPWPVDIISCRRRNCVFACEEYSIGAMQCSYENDRIPRYSSIFDIKPREFLEMKISRISGIFFPYAFLILFPRDLSGLLEPRSWDSAEEKFFFHVMLPMVFSTILCRFPPRFSLRSFFPSIASRSCVRSAVHAQAWLASLTKPPSIPRDETGTP